MVLQKSLDYGSNGYQVPPIPHVPKSAKGKRSVRKKTVNSRLCAFDLLAAVAGKLLLEGESLPNKTIGTPNIYSGKEIVKEENFNGEKPVKDKVCELGSCAEDTLGGNLVAQGKVTSEECSQAVISVPSGTVHVILKSDISNEEACTKQKSPYVDKLDEGKIRGAVVDQNASNLLGLENKMDVVAEPHALASSDNSVKVPCCGDHILNNSFSPKCQDEKFLVNRDDDESYSGCINPSSTTNKALKHQGLGHRRIRKQWATKFWKVATTITKDRGLPNTDVEMKQSFRNRKICYARQRTQRGSFKRRRLFQRCSESTSNGGISCEDNKVSSSSIKGHLTSYGSEDFHVRLVIKSFKVPELFIEIPETSTVGSLKMSVKEAVTAILGGGLRVGVLFQGKKVRDDNKTLIQAGISHGDKLDDLGFTLEPNSSQSTPQLTRSDEPCLLLSSDAAETLTRFPVKVSTSNGGKSDFTLESPLTSTGNCLESDHDSVHSSGDAFTLDKTAEDAHPLSAIPPLSVEGLPVVPIHKPRQSDIAQRRIRRPFSVSEVEALVTTVEKLGTGRWRDVKIRAFDNAEHRTYVDLKDKWKTLVHTARISPQQRRGEPVPQELLDRVHSAHAYWSQQQAKLQCKSPPTEACLRI